MSLKTETIETYNSSADALAKKFNELGARTTDIDYVFSMIDKIDPSVLEIGCGNGRDAEEICKRTTKYQGLDISEKLINIAQTKLPEARFAIADIETYAFPKDIDIVFAFASLIHVPKESFRAIMKRLASQLTDKGIVFISLKYSDTYQQVTKKDEFGTRTYWHYSQEDIEEMTPDFLILNTTIHTIRDQIWMDILLQKK